MATSPSVDQIVSDFQHVEKNLQVSPEKIIEILTLAYQYDNMLEMNKEFLDDKANGE